MSSTSRSPRMPKKWTGSMKNVNKEMMQQRILQQDDEISRLRQLVAVGRQDGLLNPSNSGSRAPEEDEQPQGDSGVDAVESWGTVMGGSPLLQPIYSRSYYCCVVCVSVEILNTNSTETISSSKSQWYIVSQACFWKSRGNHYQVSNLNTFA